MKKALIVSLHDLHPGSLEIVKEQVDFCESRGVREFSILGVPHFHHKDLLKDSKETVRWIDERVSKGNDMVLHGFYHDRKGEGMGNVLVTRLYTANEAEFWDLKEGEIRRRLEEGRRIWEERGWPLKGFIAPAWLYPPEKDTLLKELGFEYTTRLGGIYLLKSDEMTATQSLCYSTRSAWRRGVSLLWNRYLFGRLRDRVDVLRLSLHPGDWGHEKIRGQIGNFLELALSEGFEPLSYARYASM